MADKIGFRKDEVSGGYKWLNFSEMAKHIGWRVAHFVDEAKLGREQTFESFLKYMDKTGVRVTIQDGKMVYSDTVNFGFGLTEEQISPLVGFSELNNRFDGGIKPELIPTYQGNVEIIQQGLGAFNYTPDSSERTYLNNVLRAAYSEVGLKNTFKPMGLSAQDNAYDAMVGTRLAGAKYNPSTRKWTTTPQSKTYKPVGNVENTYTVESHDRTRNLVFSSIGATNLKDFVENTYKDGNFMIHGQAVFSDAAFRGQRKKIPSLKNYQKNGKAKGYEASLPYGTIPAFRSAFAADANDINTKVFTTVSYPNIIPQLRTVFGIDVDKLDVPAGVDFLRNRDESIEYIRSKLPESLADCDMVVMLSSSYGMHSNGATTAFVGRTNQLSCRLWFRSDKPMDAEDFGALLRHHGADLNADNSIYSHNQPVYGDPIFENGRDPLRGNRRIFAKGLTETFDVELLEEEITEMDKELGWDSRQVAAYSSSAALPKKKIDVNPADGPIEQSRHRVLVRLQAIGDRKALMEYTGHQTHFDAVRTIINAHVNAVYDEFPASQPLVQGDAFNPERKDVLANEVRFLHNEITNAFNYALQNPQKVVDAKSMNDKGITQMGITQGGKVDSLINDATVSIAQKARRKYERHLEQMLQSPNADKSLVDEYIKTYTVPTIVEGRFKLKADVFSQTPVLQNENGIYLDNPAIASADHRMRTFDGSKKFYFTTENNPKVSPAYEQGSLEEVYANAVENSAVRKVFCHNCSLEEIEHKLPQPAKSTAAIDANAIKMDAKVMTTAGFNPIQSRRRVRPEIKTGSTPSTPRFRSRGR